jgi:hypothetical protein
MNEKNPGIKTKMPLRSEEAFINDLLKLLYYYFLQSFFSGCIGNY